MWLNFVTICVLLPMFYEYGEGIMCHRCYSTMGGCGEDGVVWRMFPWMDCGDSKFCVKVISEEDGEMKIIRECESNLMKSAYHRLKMPVLRRHGYCLDSRKNDFWNPRQTTDSSLKYCFCNDWNGCNSATSVFGKIIPVLSLCFSLLFLSRRFV